MEPQHTQGVRTTADSQAEGRLKVDAGTQQRRRKRKSLRKLIQKAA